MKHIAVLLMFIVFVSTIMGCTQVASNLSANKNSSKEQHSQSTDEFPDEKVIKIIPANTTGEKLEEKHALTDQSDDRLERKSILSNQLEILIPKGFKEESPNDQEIKFRDESNQVTFTIKHDPEQKTGGEASLGEQSLKKMKGILEQNYEGAEGISEGVREVDGKHMAVQEITTKNKYVLLCWSSLHGGHLEVEVSSPIGIQEEWSVLANKMIESIRMK
ncbi:hypothetical protein [Paenibacillus agilis]|uniref:DUF1795 domain-containing protein n=1 Tax=Paenibacillus agilis TaxID=3020863 RepID=A0A559IPZ1_9BACL|nr:hypothetical protein [Paenibacillus agilis]TVX89707.1 hypothetical protein FPZ44_18295 [Paenibacillus agilis]